MGNILKGLSEILSNNGNIMEALTGSQAGDTGILGSSGFSNADEAAKNSKQYLNKAITQFSDVEFKEARAKSKASGDAQTEYAYLIYYTKQSKSLGISVMTTGSKGGQVAGDDWDKPKASLPEVATIIGVYHSHPLDKTFGEDNPFSDGDIEGVFAAIRTGNTLGSKTQNGFFWIADAQDRRYACLIEDFTIAKINVDKTDDDYSELFNSETGNVKPSENVMNKIRTVYSTVFTKSTGIGLYKGSHNGVLARM